MCAYVYIHIYVYDTLLVVALAQQIQIMYQMTVAVFLQMWIAVFQMKPVSSPVNEEMSYTLAFFPVELFRKLLEHQYSCRPLR